MNLRASLVLLGTIIWFLLGALTNWVCNDCSTKTDTIDKPTLISNGSMGIIPLMFDWSSDSAGSEAKLTDYLNAKLGNYNGEDSLVITGYYYPEEEAPVGFANMGLARAQKIKDMLIRQISSGEVSLENFDPNKVVLRSKELEMRPGVQQASFEGGDLTIVPPSVALPPIVFNWDDPTPITDQRLSAYLDGLLADYDGSDSLLITGYYFADEAISTGFANMGFARASKIKDLLLSQIASGKLSKEGLNPDMISLRSILLSASENAKRFPFTGSPIIDFESLAPQSTLPDIEGKATVYFPYNSTERIPNEKFDAYVQDLVEVLLKSEKSLMIIGHTDSIGGEAYNQDLGLNRARVVRQMLIDRGVASERMQIGSKGFLEPASTNETDKGRQLNRRAELIIQQ